MKKYISKIFVLLPALVIFVGINYFVDPENLFSGGNYEKGIADDMLKGENVTGLYNFDERLLQKYFIEDMQSKPDVVVIGPSRSFLINATTLGTNEKVINNSVSGPTIEDQFAIFDMYLKKGWLPKKVIIGLDPYFLADRKSSRNLYGSIRNYYYDLCDTLHIPVKKDHEFSFKYRNLKKLFTIQYFQESVLFAINTGNAHKYIPTDVTENNTLTKLPDGSIVYGKETRDRTPEEVADIVKTVNSDELTSYFQPIDHYDQDYIAKFEKFIDFLKSKNIQVELVMAPFHPDWYKHFTSDPKFKLFLGAEDFYIQLAHRKNIHFYGSINPAACGVGYSDFYDEMHLKAPGMAKVLKFER